MISFFKLTRTLFHGTLALEGKTLQGCLLNLYMGLRVHGCLSLKKLATFQRNFKFKITRAQMACSNQIRPTLNIQGEETKYCSSPIPFEMIVHSSISPSSPSLCRKLIFDKNMSTYSNLLKVYCDFLPLISTTTN